MPKKGYNPTLEHRENLGKALKGRAAWNKGRKETRPEVLNNISRAHIGIKQSAESIEKMRLKHLDPRPYRWKEPNKKIGYRGSHHWIEKAKGKPITCEHCGKTGLTGKAIQWANKDHKYKFEAKDWMRLCIKCHKKYDLKFNKVKI